MSLLRGSLLTKDIRYKVFQIRYFTEVAPLTEIVTNIIRTNSEIASKTADLIDMLGQLRGTTPEVDAELKAFLEAFKG